MGSATTSGCERAYLNQCSRSDLDSFDSEWSSLSGSGFPSCIRAIYRRLKKSDKPEKVARTAHAFYKSDESFREPNQKEAQRIQLQDGFSKELSRRSFHSIYSICPQRQAILDRSLRGFSLNDNNYDRLRNTRCEHQG